MLSDYIFLKRYLDSTNMRTLEVVINTLFDYNYNTNLVAICVSLNESLMMLQHELINSL